MNDLRRDHHCFEDNVSDLKFIGKRSIHCFFEFLIKDVVSLRSCLKILQSFSKFVLFALQYARLRFLMCLRILEFIQGGSAGLIVTTLFGMQCFDKSKILSTKAVV